MRLKLALAAALAVGVLVLAGCINYDQELALNPDGSGVIKVHYNSSAQPAPGTEKEGEESISLSTAPKLAFTKEEIEKEYEGAPFKPRDIKVETIDKVPNATYYIDFKNVSDLNGRGVFALEGDKLKQTFSLADVGENKVFKQLVHLEIKSVDNTQLSGYKFTYKLTAPGEVVETNGTKGEGNTVTWEYTLDKLINKDTEMAVAYKAAGPAAGGAILWIIIALVIIVVIVIVIILVVTLSKKKKGGAPTPAA